MPKGAKKGHKKVGGRKPGTPNKVTKEARAIFNEVMEGEMPNIKKALDSVRTKSPGLYLKSLSALMPFFMSKKVDVTTDGEKIPAAIPNIQVFNTAPPMANNEDDVQ